MTVLITGINGFAGSHLAESLLRHGVPVSGTVLHSGHCRNLASFADRLRIYELDLGDREALGEVLRRERPEFIYHLAGQAFVKDSWEDPEKTYDVNFLGTFHLYESAVRMGISPRILYASSAEVYGDVVDGTIPFKEDLPLRPTTPYAVSKGASELLSRQYTASKRLSIVCARAFNHIGPRQDSRFVCASFAKQIAEMEAGRREPIIEVGNLDAMRDFTDVRDIVQAYRMILEDGTPGEVYNVCSGEVHSIRSILDRLLSLAEVAIEIRIDESRLRPLDVPVLAGDNSRVSALGWKRTISLSESLRDILNDWRERVRNT